MSDHRNWHAIEGPNGQCACGVAPDGSVVTCAGLLDQEIAARADAQPLAQRFFDLRRGLEGRLDDALLACFGVADSEKTETWPCGHMVYDDYDDSFELWHCKDDFVPTAEQMDAAAKLGFVRGWFCYADGTERYCLGERKKVSHPRDDSEKYEERRHRRRVERLTAALTQAADDLETVGNDYPGSSCQTWCAAKAAAIRQLLS